MTDQDIRVIANPSYDIRPGRISEQLTFGGYTVKDPTPDPKGANGSRLNRFYVGVLASIDGKDPGKVLVLGTVDEYSDKQTFQPTHIVCSDGKVMPLENAPCWDTKGIGAEFDPDAIRVPGILSLTITPEGKSKLAPSEEKQAPPKPNDQKPELMEIRRPEGLPKSSPVAFAPGQGKKGGPRSSR